MKLRRIIFYVALIGAALPAAFGYRAYVQERIDQLEPRILARSESPLGVSHVELLSPVYELDRIYKSMEGPNSNQPEIRLSERAPAEETLWITGVSTEILDADSREVISREYFCHANLTLNPDHSSPEAHNSSFASPTHLDWRIFTLVPGRMSIHLPEGFGIPIRNATPIDYYTMSLNQNPGKTRAIRMKTRLHYVRAQEASAAPIHPLFRRAVYVYQQHRLGETIAPTVTIATLQDIPTHKGEQCALSCTDDQRGTTASGFAVVTAASSDKPVHPGATCCVANASSGGIMDQFGTDNTIHWFVPPGHHLYRSEVTEQLNLPFDTTVHYATGHLHPFGKSLKLIDMDTGAIVFHITSRDFDDRLGVEHMSEESSIEGVPIKTDHRYELVAEYENSTGAPIDAMAILYLYASEQRIERKP